MGFNSEFDLALESKSRSSSYSTDTLDLADEFQTKNVVERTKDIESRVIGPNRHIQPETAPKKKPKPKRTYYTADNLESRNLTKDADGIFVPVNRNINE